MRPVLSTDPTDPEREPVPVGRRSFDAFYRAEVDQLYRALAVTLGDHHVAREAVDEAMARACARWSTIAGYDRPGGWVYRVGLNWARSRWRKLQREEQLDAPVDDDETPTLLAVLPVVPPPEEGAPGGPALAALRRLPVDQRAVIVCRVLLDLDTAATAEVLGIPTGTAKSRLARGLATLRHQIDPIEEDDR